MVGFHDILCVLLTDNIPVIKSSSKDTELIPWILKKWKEKFINLNYEIVKKLINYDAVIATGSENSSIYFKYYFKKIPHIIRKQRTSVAILSGK